jgi:hypothetical protein
MSFLELHARVLEDARNFVGSFLLIADDSAPAFVDQGLGEDPHPSPQPPAAASPLPSPHGRGERGQGERGEGHPWQPPAWLAAYPEIVPPSPSALGEGPGVRASPSRPSNGTKAAAPGCKPNWTRSFSCSILAHPMSGSGKRRPSSRRSSRPLATRWNISSTSSPSSAARTKSASGNTAQSG